MRESPEIGIGAAIVPALGLGGLMVGTPIRQISEWLRGEALRGEALYRLAGVFEARYRISSGIIELAVDVRNGKVARLTAFEGYQGALFGLIRPGMLVGEAMRLDPRLQYDEGEGLLLCAGHPGVSLDLADDDPELAGVPNLRIVAVSVTLANIDSPAVQRGDW